MISKELLSEVLEKELKEINIRRQKENLISISEFSKIEIVDNCIFYYESMQNTYPYNPIGRHKINIYELAHKCKEWAYQKGYEINESYDFIELEKIENCYIPYQSKECLAYSPIKIFKACEWILNNN